MAEFSLVWDGFSLGDATSAPYDASIEFALLMSLAGGVVGFSVDTTGVYMGALNGLQASGTASPVAINTGYAMVNGTAYENTGSVNVAIPTPVSSTRIDRIVLRKDWAAQTIRIHRIAGVEGGSAPAVIQSAGSTWDCKMFQASITTGAAITLTDERICLGMRPGTYIWDSSTASRLGSQCVEAVGTAKNKADYVVLDAMYAGASYPYGSASTTFNIPDHRGRAATMYDAAAGVLTSFATLGLTLGTQTHTVLSTESPIVSHAHAGSTVGVGTLTLPDHDHNIPYSTTSGGGLTITNAFTNGVNAGNLISGSATSAPGINGSPSLSIAASSAAAANPMSLMSPALADECWVFLGGLGSAP